MPRKLMCTNMLLLILSAFCSPAFGHAKGKTVLEQWMDMRTKDFRFGYQHIHSQEALQNGQRLIRTVVYQETTILAGDKPFKDKSWQETLETADGKVVEVGYRMYLSREQVLKVRGTITGSELTLRVIDDDGKPTRFSQKVPWDAEILGQHAQDAFFRGKMLNAKDRFHIKAFDFTLHRILPTTWTVEAVENVEVDKMKKKLVRVRETHPSGAGLPDSHFWVDDAGSVVKQQLEIGNSLVTCEAVSREAALAKFEPKIKEEESDIPIDKPLKDASPAELVLRVEVQGEENPRALFAEDGRQKILKADKKGVVELKLLARAPVVLQDKIQPAPAEYLESNFFVRSDHPRVVKLAEQAVGKAKTPANKVKAIGAWIKDNVKGSYEINHATADEVARILEGDCTEYSVLAAAMCRAVGIPARIAVGAVYVSDPKPGFGAHQWVEVYLDGQWQTFDPTGSIDAVGAAYFKVADYSMNGVINPDSLEEFQRLVSRKVKISVLPSK